MGVNMDYLNEDSTHAAQGADSYGAVADSTPWGVKQAKTVKPFGAGGGIDGFYDGRDDLVGSSDTQWNRQPSNVEQQSGASFASYSDSAPSFVSGSGLDGERTKFSDTLGPDALSEGRF